MRLKLTINCIALSLKELEGKEGRHYYQVSVDQDGEAGTLGITEECYERIKPVFKKYQPASLTCEYNDQYGNMRIINIKQ